MMNRYEAQQCCVNNYGFLAQPSSQAEHDLIKTRLQTSEGSLSSECMYIIKDNSFSVDGNYTSSYWLGGVDYFGEMTQFS